MTCLQSQIFSIVWFRSEYVPYVHLDWDLYCLADLKTGLTCRRYNLAKIFAQITCKENLFLFGNRIDILSSEVNKKKVLSILAAAPSWIFCMKLSQLENQPKQSYIIRTGWWIIPLSDRMWDFLLRWGKIHVEKQVNSLYKNERCICI